MRFRGTLAVVGISMPISSFRPPVSSGVKWETGAKADAIDAAAMG